ncbi:DUF1801 domain-containing protein [Croceibacterium sp. LX-88]|uniref:DUF1801 domain-containing protein n=1 Tax=Croceibacterium selenioxidans TaxID=2838833 RepID=A0ABS5W100_9SPHN|nr:DUF1801 domain-containing protein [Croceibacterium selenioxidans]MBT2133379.1 DUF1801 domain-containing protein [Croceibacterium selenioxidans]
MAEAKTKPTQVSVAEFIAAVEPASKREDAPVLDALFRKVTGVEPEMWGPTIIGYGEYNTVYDSGRKVRCCRAGFSPRKAKHSLYLLPCGDDEGSKADFEALLARLGKHSLGQGGCLYVNKIGDIDLGVLEEMIALAWKNSFARYPD